MDDALITDYAAAKREVKQSFLGRMVGPAFVAGALAATASLVPFPVGAYDTIPTFMAPATNEFPTAAEYFASFIRNATITGVLASSPAIYKYYQDAQEQPVEDQPVTSKA